MSGAALILAKLYNLLLLKGYYAKHFKINRTTLIPKQGKDTKYPRNWRPITIGSILGRIFSGGIDTRLRGSIELSNRQKGFVRENGCKHNTVTLSSVLSRMKSSRGGVPTVVDISKAFGTVPHAAIGKALTSKRVPKEVRTYIKEMYEQCATTIKAGNENIQVTLKRSVKQGDPLSPLLFNAIIDPIITKIHEEMGGIVMNSINVAVLAFKADIA